MEKKLKEIIATVLSVDISKIDEGASSETIENWDSLRHMKLMIALEDEFSLEFDDDEIMRMFDYKAVLEVLLKKSNLTKK